MIRIIVLLFLVLNFSACGQHLTKSSGIPGRQEKTGSADTGELLQAVQNGEVDIVQAYLEAGGDVNRRFDGGKTLLIVAVEWSRFEVAQYLMENNADPEVRDEQELSAFDHAGENKRMQAILNKQWDFFNELVKRLFKAVEEENSTELKEVLELGADINARDEVGRTVLIWAVELRKSRIVKRLIRYEEIDVNAVDDEGRSALSIAKANGDSRIVKWLEVKGAVDAP
jgi:ankyrin repeat protein